MQRSSVGGWSWQEPRSQGCASALLADGSIFALFQALANTTTMPVVAVSHVALITGSAQ
jgi:hypothetical protein